MTVTGMRCSLVSGLPIGAFTQMAEHPVPSELHALSGSVERRDLPAARPISVDQTVPLLMLPPGCVKWPLWLE